MLTNNGRLKACLKKLLSDTECPMIRAGEDELLLWFECQREDSKFGASRYVEVNKKKKPCSSRRKAAKMGGG